MLLYDHIFHREMCSMTFQTGRPLPDSPEGMMSQLLCHFIGEDCQDQFLKILTAN